MDESHVVSHRYDCMECHKYFLVKKDLESHVSQEHTNVQYVITEVDEENTSLKEKRIFCPMCHTSFMHKQSLKRHMKTIHVNPVLEQHVEVEKVNGQSVFICKICNKQSQFYRITLIHVKSHLSEMDNVAGEVSNNEVGFQHGSHTEEQILILPEETAEEGEIIVPAVDRFELVYGHDYQEDIKVDEKNHALFHKSNYRCAICSRHYPSRFHLKRHMRIHLNDHEANFDEPLDEEAFSELNSSIMINDSDEVEIKPEFIG